MPAILSGLRVIDFTQGMAGSLATMLLADNGADVVKVEPPGGDPYRKLPAWIMWNRGKRSVVLDLSLDEGRESARALALGADVVVENGRLAELGGPGLGYESLAHENPRLVYCSITGLGSTGQYADLPPYEGLVAARSGDYLQVAGWLQREGPAYRARPNGSYGAAHLATQGIVAALRAREHIGVGQRVETSLYQGLTCYDAGSSLNRQVALGLSDVELPPASGTVSIMGRIAIPYLVARCKDGQWMQMTNMAARLFPSWMRAIGLGDIFDDPRFQGAPFNMEDEHRETLRRMVLERMLEKTFDEWIEIFTEGDVAGDRFVTTQQAMDHPQFRALDAVVAIDDPTVGPTEQIGPLAYFSETPSVIGVPAPRLGEHTAEVLAEAESRPRAPMPAGNGDGPALTRPLEGMLVIDFASWLAAPLGTALVADLGARVIKVEPLTGDEFRFSSMGLGRTFQGKESLVVDLKREEGKALMRRLLERADGLLHNMRGEAPQRLGIDYDSVRAISPSIVYLYAGSYGSTGPGAGRAAFHPIGGALSGGVLWQLGNNNQPPPNDVQLTLDEVIAQSEALLAANEGSPDVTSAISVGTAMALGLFAKERTGAGQYIETRMLVANGYICSDDFIRYEGKPPRLEVDEYLRGTHALHRLYETADGWCFVDVQLEPEWAAFCGALGREQLASDPRFLDEATRLRHDDQLVALLGLAFRELPADEWERAMQAEGAPCVRADVREASDFFLADPAVAENGFIAAVEGRLTGKMMRQGTAVGLSRTPGRAEPAAAFGENGPDILEELGYSAAEGRELHEGGVIAWPAELEPAAASV